MDEVACLLADKPPACCSKYRGGGSGGGSTSTKPPPSGGGGGASQEDLNKSDISAGIGKVRGKVEGCAAKSSAKGTVKVSVKVSGNGTVSSVTVKESPDAGLGSCVASAVQKATFTKTQNGGSFSYPFTFR
jgi:TonB family protein